MRALAAGTASLLLVLATAQLAAAQPAASPRPPPPDAAQSLPPDPAAEPAAEGRAGGSSLERVGDWPYGPSYAIVASADGQTVYSGHGRVLRIEGPAGTVPGREDLQMPGLVRDLAFDGTHVYVATSSSTVANRGITVVEPSPAGSGVVGGVYGRTCVSLAVEGTRLYAVVFDAALASYVLLVLDRTAPGGVPALLGSVPFAGTGGGIAVLGTTVYVAAGAAGVAVIDAADAAAPVVVRTVTAGAFNRRLAVRTLDGFSTLAVGSGQYTPTSAGSVTVFDLATPTDPAFVLGRTAPSPVEDVAWGPGRFAFFELYAAVSTSGLYTLDNEGRFELAVYPASANVVPGLTRLALAPASADRALLTADYYYGTAAYDAFLFDGEDLSVGYSFATGAVPDAQDPAVLYVADGSYGVARLRAEAGGRLVETGRAHDATWNYTQAVAQNATHLYVADGFSGVHVVDKATMERVTTLLGTAPQPNSNEVAVSADGRTLFVRDRQTVVDAYSLATPASPTRLWQRTGLDPATFASDGGVLYVGESVGSSVRVLSLAQPTSPVQVATRPTEGANVGVVLDGQRLYAFGGSTGISVFDTSVPAAPALLGTAQTAGGTAFDARGGALYVGGTSGLAVYDATAPDSPVVLASYSVGRAGGITDVDATATDVFLSEGSSGVERLAARIRVAAGPGVAPAAGLAAAPNPTAGRTVVTFTLAEPADVTAEVVDVLGRRVRVLADGPAAAGAQRLEWDGRDGSGRAVAAGVYVVRVSAGAAVWTRMLTVVR